MDDVAIKVDHVSKIFKLPHERQSSLKSTLINFNKRGYEQQKALDNVSFEVKKGEFFGIVGRNGSGKSTLLKLIAGIYNPTSGGIKINGSLTPFIELGVGFNPELTGRENVFLNGSLLGFNRRQMNQMYDDIVEFAELEKFMDQKLKNYSSGMQVRLAFSIAIRARADILLLDEVLAVGDAAFQKKCRQYFRDAKDNKKTVVLVTHDMKSVIDFCDRAMLIDSGVIKSQGSSKAIAEAYIKLNQPRVKKGESKHQRQKTPSVKLTSIELPGKKEGDRLFKFKADDPITIDLHYECTVNHRTIFAFNFTREDGLYVCGFNSFKQLGTIDLKRGKGKIRCQVNPSQLNEGVYYINGTIYDEDFSLIDFMDVGYGIEVPLVQILDSTPTDDGIFKLKGKWTMSKV